MRYLKFLCLTILVSLIFGEALIFGIICYPKNIFDASYQSVIQDKFRLLEETNEPKIIIVAGSSSAFGLDQNRLEEATGYKVVNLGLHAGFGNLFISELSKANINEGDIVLLGYEYTWPNEKGFQTIGTDLVMSGIDDNIRMYKYIPVNKWKSVIGYLFAFAGSKSKYVSASGIYSREAFDSDTGQMTMIRNDCMDYNPEEYGTVDISDKDISDASVEYLTDYKKYIEDNGAHVYFIAPPLLKDGVIGDYTELYKLRDMEEKMIGIQYISDPVQYLYPQELMFDTLYHCNSEGERVRTEMLIEDLRRASIIE